jgi:hypothetical protein
VAGLYRLELRIEDIAEEDWWPFIRALFDLHYDIDLDGRATATIGRVLLDAMGRREERIRAEEASTSRTRRRR